MKNQKNIQKKQPKIHQQTVLPQFQSKTATSTSPKKVQKIFDQQSLTNIGIIYWQQSTLEEFTRLSGPLAKANEYQIHYWALVLRKTFDDGSILDVALPTVIYNYEQFVSSAHVDFELKDVEETSEALLPVHNMVVNQLLAEYDFSGYELINVPLNTLHRHPTGISSFSGTDYRKDHEKDTGIVFPLATGKNTPSFSSIIYNDPVKMVHGEYRLANGAVASDEGITYTQGRCASIVQAPMTIPSQAAHFFGDQPTDLSYIVNKQNLQIPESFIDTLKNIKYTPNTQFVKPENVKQKTYTTTSKFSTQFPKSTRKEVQKHSTPSTNITTALAEDFKKNYGITMLPIVDILKLNLRDAKRQLLHLEKHYYGKDDPTINLESYSDYAIHELKDQIIETQELIIEEVEDPIYMLDTEPPAEPDPYAYITRSDMEVLLRMCGIAEKDITSATDDQITAWYTEVCG